MRHLATLEARPARIGDREIGFLGWVVTGGRAWYFFRDADRTVVLVLAPTAAGVSGFRAGRRLVAQSLFFPERRAGDDRFEDRLGAQLLRREDEVADTLAAHRGSCAEPPPAMDALPEPGCLLGVTVPLPGTGTHARIVFARPGVLPLSIADWSADVVIPEGNLGPRGTHDVRQRLLGIAAHMLAGGSFRFDHGIPDERTLTGVDLNLLLGDREGNRRRLDATRPVPGRLMFVLLDLPSTCRNACSYCQAGGNPGWKRALGDVPGDLDALLPRLDELAASASEVRVSLGGNDPLESGHFLDVLSRVAPLASPGGLEIVTPGTRLADAAFVRRIAAVPGAGRTRFHLTVLGPDAATHDRVAGRDGAWDDLGTSLRNIREAGLSVDLGTVVVRDNLDALPATLAWIADQGLRVCVAAFCEDGRLREEAERSYVPYDRLRAVFDAHRDLVDRVVHRVVHVPYCLFPEWMPSSAPNAVVCEPVPGIGFPPEPCVDCVHFGTRCQSVGGPHYVALHGIRSLAPVRRFAAG